MTTRDADRKTRRATLTAGLAAVGGAISLRAQPARAQPAQKIAQKVVQYQESPKGTQKCANCVNFQAPDACKIVEGPINPEGWCIAFAPKAS